MRCGFGSAGKRGLRAESGVSAVEFALLLPLMLLIVCGIMGFGNLYFQLNVANNAAREGARRAAVSPTRLTIAQVQTTLRSEYGSSLTVNNLDYDLPATGAVTAKVTITVTVLTPYIARRIPNFPTSVTAQCVMRVEN